MFRLTRVATAGLAIVALAAGIATGWPGPAQADAPSPADGTTTEPAAATPVAVAGPVALATPPYLVAGHRVEVELLVRTAARRDLVRVDASFADADGNEVAVVPVSARVTGGDWRTVPFVLDVPEGARTVTLRWSAVVGPLEVAEPKVVSVASSAAGDPGDD